LQNIPRRYQVVQSRLKKKKKNCFDPGQANILCVTSATRNAKWSSIFVRVFAVIPAASLRKFSCGGIRLAARETRSFSLDARAEDRLLALGKRTARRPIERGKGEESRPLGFIMAIWRSGSIERNAANITINANGSAPSVSTAEFEILATWRAKTLA